MAFRMLKTSQVCDLVRLWVLNFFFNVSCVYFTFDMLWSNHRVSVPLIQSWWPRLLSQDDTCGGREAEPPQSVCFFPSFVPTFLVESFWDLRLDGESLSVLLCSSDNDLGKYAWGLRQVHGNCVMKNSVSEMFASTSTCLWVPCLCERSATSLLCNSTLRIMPSAQFTDLRFSTFIWIHGHVVPQNSTMCTHLGGHDLVKTVSISNTRRIFKFAFW